MSEQHTPFLTIFPECAALSGCAGGLDKAYVTDVKIEAASGADGRLYGSITSQHVADALKAQGGVDIDKRKIVLPDPIKAYGKFEIPVKLYASEIMGKINLIVTDK